MRVLLPWAAGDLPRQDLVHEQRRRELFLDVARQWSVFGRPPVLG